MWVVTERRRFLVRCCTYGGVGLDVFTSGSAPLVGGREGFLPLFQSLSEGVGLLLDLGRRSLVHG
jgi:hypothetical protein